MAPSPHENIRLPRRELLSRAGIGLGMLGLSGLLSDEGLLHAAATDSEQPLRPKRPHFPPRATRVVPLWPQSLMYVARPSPPSPIPQRGRG